MRKEFKVGSVVCEVVVLAEPYSTKQHSIVFGFVNGARVYESDPIQETWLLTEIEAVQQRIKAMALSHLSTEMENKLIQLGFK